MAKKTTTDTLTGTGQPSERIKTIAEQRAVTQPAQQADTLTGTGQPSERVQAIAAQRQVATPTPVAPTAPVNPVTPEVPKTIMQSGVQMPNWNYGTWDNPVYASQSLQAQTAAQPTQPTQITQPLTTEVGREQALWQLASQPTDSSKVAQLKSVRENLKDDSGQQLWSNLSTISESNPNLLTDRRAYDQAFGYNTKDSGEKAMVDSFWRARNKMDSNSIYNALETGAQVPREATKTSQFEDAVNRKAEVNKYENLNAYQLSKELNSSLIPWTQAYNDLLAKNPKLVEDANKLSRVNMGVTARQDTKTDYMQMISDYFTKSQVMQEPITVEKIMNSDPNIANKTSEVQGIDGQITEAKDRLKNIKAEVTERYKGTGATKATIQAKALAESQDLIDEITMLEANRSSASAALITLIQNAKDNYTYAKEARQEAIQSQQQQLQNLMSFAKMGIEQDNLEYQRAWDQYRYDTDYLRQEAMKDSEFARDLAQMEQQFGYNMELAKMGYGQQERMAGINAQNDIAQLYAQQGFQASRDQIDQQANMVKTLVSSGYSYADAIGQVLWAQQAQSSGDRNMIVADFIKWKEWFRAQAYDDLTGKILAPWEKPKGTATLWYWFTTINGRPVQAGDTISQEQADTMFAEKVKWYQTFKNLVNVNLSPQQEAALTSLEFNGGGGIWKYPAGKELINRINSWDFAWASKYLVDSGFLTTSKGQYMKWLANRRAEEAKLLLQTQPVQTQTTQTTEDAWQKSEQRSNILFTASEISDPNKRNQFLIRNGLSEAELSEFSAGNYPATTQQRKSAEKIMREIGNLAKIDWNDAVWLLDPGRFLSQGGADAKAKIDTIVSTVTQPDLGLLKGPMSNADLEFIKSGASTLDPRQSNDAFESNILQLYNFAARKAWQPEAESMDEIKNLSNRPASTGIGSTQVTNTSRAAEILKTLK